MDFETLWIMRLWRRVERLFSYGKPEPVVVLRNGTNTTNVKKTTDTDEEGYMSPVQLTIVNGGNAACGEVDVELRFQDSSKVWIYDDNSEKYSNVPETLKYHLEELAARQHKDNLLDCLFLDSRTAGMFVIDWTINSSHCKNPAKGKLNIYVS